MFIYNYKTTHKQRSLNITIKPCVEHFPCLVIELYITCNLMKAHQRCCKQDFLNTLHIKAHSCEWGLTVRRGLIYLFDKKQNLYPVPLYEACSDQCKPSLGYEFNSQGSTRYLSVHQDHKKNRIKQTVWRIVKTM